MNEALAQVLLWYWQVKWQVCPYRLEQSQKMERSYDKNAVNRALPQNGAKDPRPTSVVSVVSQLWKSVSRHEPLVR